MHVSDYIISQYEYEYLTKNAEIQRVGSRAVCNPPPEGSDEDWLVLVHDPFQLKSQLGYCDITNWLTSRGYRKEGYNNYSGGNSLFTSYRKGLVNILVTEDFRFYKRWGVATEVCRYLNITDRNTRVGVHRIILYESKT